MYWLVGILSILPICPHQSSKEYGREIIRQGNNTAGKVTFYSLIVNVSDANTEIVGILLGISSLPHECLMSASWHFAHIC